VFSGEGFVRPISIAESIFTARGVAPANDEEELECFNEFSTDQTSMHAPNAEPNTQQPAES